MGYPEIKKARREALLARARSAPAAMAGVDYPDWYLRRWHFHPDGYLSAAGAGWYEQVIHRLYNVGVASLVYREVARRFAKRRATSIADIGCGAGHLVRTLATGLAEARITGVELSPWILARARRKRPDTARVSLVHGDATQPDVIPPGVDGCVAVHVLGHVPRQVARDMMGAACAAMAANGTFLAVDHRWHAPPPVPQGLQLWRRRGLAGGILVLREYRRVPDGDENA